MILLWALVGLGVGSAINWARDYLPRFSNSRPPSFESGSRSWFALWQALQSLVSGDGSGYLQRSLWLNLGTELISILFFVYLWQRFGPSWRLLLLAAAGSFFLLVAVIDLKYRLVLNVMVFPAAAVTLLLHVISPERDIRSAFVGGAFGLTIFLLAALVRRGGLGAGDVKLAALIGLVVGFPEVLWALALGIVAGGITALLLVVSPRWELGSYMPYAPFLCLGAVVALIYNPLPLVFSS